MDIKQVMAGNPDQGNLNLVKQSKADRVIQSEKPSGYYQLFILGGIGILLALFVGYAYAQYLYSGLTIWIALLLLFPFFACSILQAFLAKKVAYRARFIVVEAIALCLPFFRMGWLILVPTAVFMFLFMLWGYIESRSELSYGTEIRFFKVSRPVTAKLLTAFVAFMIFFFAIAPATRGIFFVSQEKFDAIFQGGAVIFTDFYPGILVNGSFQDFAQSVAKAQLSNNTSYQALAPADQITANTDAATTFEDNFSKTLGVTITPSSTTSGVMYDCIVTALNNWHDQFGPLFVIVWAFAVFLALRSIGVLFILIVQFLTMIVYEILLAAGIVRVVEHPQTKEVIEFS
jgi:hypothetical protein